MRFWQLFLTALLFTSTAFAHYGARFEPPDGRIYHGSGWNYQNSQQIYEGIFPGDRRPLILQINTSIPGMRGTTVSRLVQSLTQPVVHPDSQYVEFSMHWQGRDATQMLDSVYVYTDQWDSYVDSLEAAFRQVNRPFFFRIGFEFNGNWNPYHPWIYPLAFRKLVLELRHRGINNFATVWCYEPDADGTFADSTDAGWKWYPGDDVVDWFGLDVFQVEHFDPSLADSGRGGLTKKGKSEAFLRFAEVRRKPVYLSEFSSIHTSSTPDSLDADSSDGRSDWDSFFVPFFRFVDNHPNIKGWNYIDINWSSINSYADQGWRDARLEINVILRENWAQMMTDQRFINAGWDITQAEDVKEFDLVVSEFELASPYPNPFNSSVVLRYALHRPGTVSLGVYDLQGRIVDVLVRGWNQAGTHQIVWDATGRPSGLYFVKLESAGGVTRHSQMVLIR